MTTDASLRRERDGDDDDPLLRPPFSSAVSLDDARPTTLTDLDPLALSLILSSAGPADAAALAASCTILARGPGAGCTGLWRALSIDARAVPDSRAPPPGPRHHLPGGAAAPRRSLRTRAAATDVARWLSAGGRGAAAEQLRLAWHPAIAASAAVADAALAGTPRASRLALDAGATGGALAALPKALSGRDRVALEALSITAASMDTAALAAVDLGGLRRLTVRAALTGWAPLLPPGLRFPHLHTVALIHTNVRELPPGLAGATGLQKLTVVGARLGRDRWSAAATGGAAWSPVGVLARLKSLETLTLEDCGLETVPGEVAACTRLRTLGLARNALRSFSCAAVGGLERLEVLDLRDNALGGPLPVKLVEGLVGLKEVRVEGNPYLVKREAFGGR